jgi:hypothetical protein
MIRVSVRDTAGNVFAFHDLADSETAIGLASSWIEDGFRVEIVPVIELEICGVTSPTSAFVCNLTLGHSGDHRDVHPSGGMVGWSA